MYTPTETTEVEYTVEFNNATISKLFEDKMATDELFNEAGVTFLDAEVGGQAVEFTLPREDIRKFEFFRKHFMVNNCVYADQIITTSIYK